MNCYAPGKTVVDNNSIFSPTASISECGFTLQDWQVYYRFAFFFQVEILFFVVRLFVQHTINYSDDVYFNFCYNHL
jgi:hypothetical protein